jgi:hypothetical protein
MKQNNTRRQSPKQSPRQSKQSCQGSLTIGMDLGGKTSRYCG